MSVFSLPKRHPFLFGVSITGIKTAAMDVLVQTVEKRDDKFKQYDLKRTFTFGVFGLLFNGAWQYALFVKMMPLVTPHAFTFAAKPIREKIRDIPGIKAVLLQNFVENGINNPILYFPCFYATSAYVDGIDNYVQYGIERYKLNWKEDLRNIWSVWVPAQTINFAFSPAWFRVPFVAIVSCLWTGIVSITRGGGRNS